MIASIAVSAVIYAIDKPYSYLVPREMDVQPGMRVMVPFGKGNRRSEGIVLALSEGEAEGLKSITAVLDEAPVLTPAFIRMAAFVRERYFCTFYDAIKAMLPAGLWFRQAETYVLTEKQPDLEALQKQEHAWPIMEYLIQNGGRAEPARLKTLFPEEENLESGLQYLLKKKLIRSNVDFSRKVHDKSEKIASLAISAEETMEYAMRKKRSAPLQYEVLRLLCTVGSASTKELCYLTGATMATVNRLEKLGYLSLSVRDVFRNPLPEFVEPARPLILNERQQQVYEGLLAQSQKDKPGVALLYGVTGSGKTSVYIQLIRAVLERGKTAIFLVPEISLTPQLLTLLMSHFGSEVAVLHSALRVSERYDEWKRIRQGKARVAVGTRSAVFAPVENLGIVIVDEEQEHTYKSENAPRYHAREMAIYRGSKDKALVLLGSATPALESMYHAKNGTYTLYTLPERYNGKHLPAVELIDMKQELRNGNGGALSRPLREALADNLTHGRQSILFLNRRGAGRHLICVDCGEVPMCPRCSVSLTYHTVNNRLMCHYCGHSQALPEDCPHCGGHLKTVGFGTQKIELELNELFPDAPVLRMDADTISASNSHEAILQRFKEEKIPILIGTQMVTKGLNFENVTLVGVVDADTSLYVDHYRAAETTFSMLTQVIGRSGRGEKPGKAMIQTMTPEHTVIQQAAMQDYDSFYDLEITLRYLQKAPPYRDVFTVLFVGIIENQVLECAGYFRDLLVKTLQSPTYADLPMTVMGPSPAAVSKVNNSYRYRLTLHCTNQKPVRLLLRQLLQVFAKEKKCKGVTALADINAYE